MRAFLIKSFVLAIFIFAGEPGWAESFSLSQTVEKILNYQPLLRAEKEKLSMIDADQRAIFAQALPSLNASGTWARNEDALNGSFVAFNGESYNTYGAKLELSVPIYGGGKLSASRKAAKKDETLQKLTVEQSARDLTIRSILLFHEVLLAQRSLETTQRLYDIQKKMLATAEKRSRVGLENRLAVLQIRTQLSLLTPQITQARNELSLLATELADMAGMDTRQELSIRGQLGPWKFPSLKDRKAEERPEWKSLEISRARIEDEKRVVLSEHFPHLSAFANLSRGGYEFSDLADSDSSQWTAGIRLTVPIFSGLQSLYQRRSYRSRQLQMEYKSMDLAKNLELARVRATQDFENAEEVESSSRTALSEAQEAVRLAQQNYQKGISDYMQVSEIQKQLADAERSFARSQFQVLVAFCKLHEANGWDVSTLPKTIEDSLVNNEKK